MKGQQGLHILTRCISLISGADNFQISLFNIQAAVHTTRAQKAKKAHAEIFSSENKTRNKNDQLH